MLASSLDYEQTLRGVAELAVPGLADWCAVDMPADDGELEPVALAHVDPDDGRGPIDIASERYPPPGRRRRGRRRR